jgi:hypothetical protein
MSDCCSSSSCDSNYPKKQRCPGNGKEYSEVSARTIAHHIKDAWAWQSSGHRYFFCDDPDCEIVYFSDNGSTILKSQLRTHVGLKELTDNTSCAIALASRRQIFLPIQRRGTLLLPKPKPDCALAIPAIHQDVVVSRTFRGLTAELPLQVEVV